MALTLNTPDLSWAERRSHRPTRLIVPDFLAGCQDESWEKSRSVEGKLTEARGRDFFVAAKRGRRREFMEDGYDVMLDIMGDPKQAFFAVIDGHGGRMAADYVSKNLGKNIVERLQYDQKDAIRGGYLVTDQGFLDQGKSSGACAASVLLKDGELHVANLGDCRVVLCRNGVAHALTEEHRLARDDERLRIETAGGLVECRNGVWRVQGTLAVSRAIGDRHLKEWVISDPHITTLPLTSHCQFLIIASDGLWDKVDNQEAVDLIIKENSEVACKKLVDMSSSRGNMDDITVMYLVSIGRSRNGHDAGQYGIAATEDNVPTLSGRVKKARATNFKEMLKPQCVLRKVVGEIHPYINSHKAQIQLYI